MFKKLLIANRGEIAVRVIRAAREMGISTIAVYSDCDRLGLHVRMADEAYRLGPSPSTESYLNLERIIEIAQSSRADAIHPGYGFLSENPEFPRRCLAAGICFVGPGASAMEQMGGKIEARKTALEAKVSVVPGTEEPLKEEEQALKIARQIGFPVLIKAATGGGGKGMRYVEAAEQLSSAFRDAQSEAKAAFGNSEVYLEKYLNSPRHIEFQVLADRHGTIVHLGERECSIQRRHQKVIEESPSPLMTDELRWQMGEAAVKVAGACGYENAGTVEFLVDAEKNYYFLEMNTRLQVEHPITEMVTGIDLVKEQLKVACGEKLSFSQQDVRWHGSAMECRIYAEDPQNDFFPSPGKILRLNSPSGPGVREDSGIYEGWDVPIYYDPLLSKLIVWGNDRNETVSRMKRALSEYQVAGIKTNLSFFKWLLAQEEFIAGKLSTDFIERHYSSGDGKSDSSSLQDIAAIAAAIHASNQVPSHARGTKDSESPWKLWGRLNGMRNR